MGRTERLVWRLCSWLHINIIIDEICRGVSIGMYFIQKIEAENCDTVEKHLINLMVGGLQWVYMLDHLEGSILQTRWQLNENRLNILEWYFVNVSLHHLWSILLCYTPRGIIIDTPVYTTYRLQNHSWMYLCSVLLFCFANEEQLF